MDNTITPDLTRLARHTMQHREIVRRYLYDRGLVPVRRGKLATEPGRWDARGQWNVYACGCAIPLAYPLGRRIVTCPTHEAALALGNAKPIEHADDAPEEIQPAGRAR